MSAPSASGCDPLLPTTMLPVLEVRWKTTALYLSHHIIQIPGQTRADLESVKNALLVRDLNTHGRVNRGHANRPAFQQEGKFNRFRLSLLHTSVHGVFSSGWCRLRELVALWKCRRIFTLFHLIVLNLFNLISCLKKHRNSSFGCVLLCSIFTSVRISLHQCPQEGAVRELWVRSICRQA